jgi:hypothetical protein
MTAKKVQIKNHFVAAEKKIRNKIKRRAATKNQRKKFSKID